MTLIFFAVLAPLLSLRWRYLAAFCAGIIMEAFSSFSFGITLGLMLFIAFFIELIEQRIAIHETAGWALAALSAIGIAALGSGAAIMIFDRVSFPLSLALSASNMLMGILMIGILWTPVKLGIMPR